MPWWNREIVQRRDVAVSSATATTIESDPEAYGDGRYPEQISGFLDVEYLDAGCTLEVYRWGGARSDLMRALDIAPVLTVISAGARRIPWPEPPPPHLKTVVKVVRTAPSGTVQATVRVLQTCRFT